MLQARKSAPDISFARAPLLRIFDHMPYCRSCARMRQPCWLAMWQHQVAHLHALVLRSSSRSRSARRRRSSSLRCQLLSFESL